MPEMHRCSRSDVERTQNNTKLAGKNNGGISSHLKLVSHRVPVENGRESGRPSLVCLHENDVRHLEKKKSQGCGFNASLRGYGLFLSQSLGKGRGDCWYIRLICMLDGLPALCRCLHCAASAADQHCMKLKSWRSR